MNSHLSLVVQVLYDFRGWTSSLVPRGEISEIQDKMLRVSALNSLLQYRDRLKKAVLILTV